MATLSVIKVDSGGQIVTYSQTDLAGGDQFPFSRGKVIVHIRNNDTTDPLNVTFVAQRQCNYGVLHDLTVTVDPSTEKVVELSDRSRFVDQNGYVNITYSGTSTQGDIAIYEA